MDDASRKINALIEAGQGSMEIADSLEDIKEWSQREPWTGVKSCHENYPDQQGNEKSKRVPVRLKFPVTWKTEASLLPQSPLHENMQYAYSKILVTHINYIDIYIYLQSFPYR